MANVLAVQSEYLTDIWMHFTDEEVDTIDIFREVGQKEQYSQAQDLRIYRRGGPHYRLEVRFLTARYETLLKLNDLFELDREFRIHPHYPADPITNYTVVWLNPEDFAERWRRGYPRSNYPIEAVFREPSGAICFPPS